MAISFNQNLIYMGSLDSCFADLDNVSPDYLTAMIPF